MTYRLAYGFLVILLISQLVFMLGLRSAPFFQDRLHYAPIIIDGKSFSIAWATSPGALNDTTALPGNESDQVNFPHVGTHQPSGSRVLKVVVNEKLPDTDAYVMRISGVSDSVTLPLHRQDDGTYATQEFLPTSDNGILRYAHGVRVVHLHDSDCSLAVERVLP